MPHIDEMSPPGHWKITKLGAVAKEFVGGGTPSTTDPRNWDGAIPWTTSAPIAESDIYLDKGQRGITSQGLSTSATHLVPRGSLLVGTRVGVGKAVVNLVDTAISQDLTGVVLDSALALPDFVAYQFKSARIQAFLAGRKRGTTIKGIARFDLEAVDLFLPPLPEQRTIVRALRAVQDAQDAQRRELEFERERKAALLQYLFTKGTRGEPTKQTEIGEMPETWGVVRLSDYLKQAQYGLSVRGEEVGTYPLLRMTNQQDGRITPTKLQYVNIADAEMRKHRLDHGDLLFNRTNSFELVGRTALFDLDGDFVFDSYLIRIKVDETHIQPQFLNSYLNWDTSQARLKGLSTRGVSQSNISASRLTTFQIPIPPVNEQTTIVESLAACDTKIAALEREAAVHEELFKAMLEELMTGKLSAISLADGDSA